MDWHLGNLKGRLTALAAAAMQAMNLDRNPDQDPIAAQYPPLTAVKKVGQPIVPQIGFDDSVDDDQVAARRPIMLTAQDLKSQIVYSVSGPDEQTVREYGPDAVLGV